MVNPRIGDPDELEHVIYLLSELVKGLPATAGPLCSLLELMADDARSDLAGEKFTRWDLRDDGDLTYVLSHPPIAPGPGEVFPRAYLNSLEEAAAEYLRALLIAIRFPEQVTGEDVERIESLGRDILGQRQSAAIARMEPDARRGRKTHQAAKKGHAAVHGTQEEKAQRYAEYQRAVEDIHKRNPHLSYTRIKQIVATNHGVSVSTIRDHTKNPCRK